MNYLTFNRYIHETGEIETVTFLRVNRAHGWEWYEYLQPRTLPLSMAEEMELSR